MQKNNQLKYSFKGVPDTELEPSSKYAATATWDITSDTGGQLGQSAPKFEDFLDHYGDGV